MTTEAEMVRAKNRTFVLEKKTGGESPATAVAGLEAKGLDGILKRFQQMGSREKWIGNREDED